MAQEVTGEPVLEGREICKSFGGLRAVVDVSLTVSEGEILGIAGPNGAGKTTLFDVITGHTRASSGDVLLDGRSIVDAPVHARSRLGLGRTFQHPTVADSLTVMENMLLAVSFRRRTDAPSDRRPAVQIASDYLEFTGLTHRASVMAGPLGVFDKKRIMLGTALATNARTLLLDEPFGGLTASEIEQTMDLIRRARDRGLAVVCIEHVMRALTALADRVLVMHHGAVFFEGTPQAMLADERVIEVYLGAKHRGQAEGAGG